MKIPLARDTDGRAITPDRAVLGQPYTCWQCGRPVVYRPSHRRAGHPVVAHFAHQGEGECTPEGWMHAAAKAALVAHLRSHREVQLEQGCTRVGCLLTRHVVHALPPYEQVEAEVVHLQWRLDVALLTDGVVVGGIEVFHRHRVEEEKAGGIAVPWVEVEAAATVADPSNLRVLNRCTLAPEHRQTLARTLRCVPRRVEVRLADLTATERVDLLERLPPEVAQATFEACQPATNIVGAWLCPRCQQVKDDWAAAERRTRHRQHSQTHGLRRALVRQREGTGRALVRPLPVRDEALYVQGADTFDAILERLAAHARLPELLGHWRWAGYEAMELAPCSACGVAIVRVDTRYLLQRPALYGSLLRTRRMGRDGLVRTVLQAACPHCGAGQESGDTSPVSATHLLTWWNCQHDGPVG